MKKQSQRKSAMITPIGEGTFIQQPNGRWRRVRIVHRFTVNYDRMVEDAINELPWNVDKRRQARTKNPEAERTLIVTGEL